MIRLKGCICFGRTVPEDSKKYGRKVCSIFYSPDMRDFIRVYPLLINNPVKMRYRCTLDLVRNEKDSRSESWKLEDPEESITDILPPPKTLQADMEVYRILKKHKSDSIKSLNNQKKSIGVIYTDLAGNMRSVEGELLPHQKELFEDVRHSFDYQATCTPYLKFIDFGGRHELQVREWGVWEFLRKNPSNSLDVFDAMRIRKNPLNYILIGNMLNHRNNWLVINWFKADPIERQADLFSSLDNAKLLNCEGRAPHGQI